MGINENNTAVYDLKQNMNYPIFSTLYGTTLLFILIANIMLIYGFYKTSRPFTTTTKLFIYLSFCEISLTSSMLLGGTFLASKSSLLTSRVTYMAIFGSIFFTTFMDLFIFWTISFLRFISILKPLYPIENRTVNRILLFDFLISLLGTSSVIFAYVLTDSRKSQMLDINWKLTLSIELSMLLLNLIINTSSIIILKRSSSTTYLAQQKDGDEESKSIQPASSAISQKQRASKTILLLTILYLVCGFPNIVVCFVDFNSLFGKPLVVIIAICQCIKMSNFGINSLIIILRTKKLRDFYAIKFCQVSIYTAQKSEPKTW